MSKTMRWVFLLLLMVVPTFICIQYGMKPAAISVACIILGCVLNEGGIEKIKIYGMEFKLRKKIEEADSLLKKLRKMAEIHGESIISTLAATQLSFVQRLNFSYTDKLIHNTNELMKELDIDPGKIRKINDVWENIYAQKYARSLFKFYQLTAEGKKDAEDILSLSEIEISDIYVKRVKIFLEKHSPQYDIKQFQNFKHFIKTGEHKDKQFLSAVD